MLVSELTTLPESSLLVRNFGLESISRKGMLRRKVNS